MDINVAIDIYGYNGEESSGVDWPQLHIIRAWPWSQDRVTLVFNDTEITVLKKDLIAAISAATI